MADEIRARGEAGWDGVAEESSSLLDDIGCPDIRTSSTSSLLNLEPDGTEDYQKIFRFGWNEMLTRTLEQRCCNLHQGKGPYR